jgi:hypothetical protein
MERRRLQRAAGITTDTASLTVLSPSSLSTELQAAFFTGKVFTMIQDTAKASSVKLTAWPEYLAKVNAKVKRTLHDLYCGADLVRQHRLDSLLSESDQPCHGDTLFTFDGYEMLYHSAVEPAPSAVPLHAPVQRSVRTPDYKRLSCAHLR